MTELNRETQSDFEPVSERDVALPSPKTADQDLRADKEIWAVSGVDISLNRLESIQKSFIRSSELFRDQDLAAANRFFVQCLDGLELFFEALVATKYARTLDFSKITTENGTLQTLEEELISILKSTLELQEAKDYSAISDKIEYELITNLYSWNASLKKLRNSFNSNA